MSNVPPPTTPPPTPVVTRQNGLALASLILGIVGFLINPVFIVSILALIFGIIGLRRAPLLGRKNMAIAGIVLSIVSAVVGFLVFSAFIAGLSGASKAISESGTVASQPADDTDSSAAVASETPSEAPSEEASSDVPAGYTAVSDDVFFKWGKTDTSNQFLTQKTAMVITPNGCGSLLIEANEYDKDGTNIGSTIGSASNLDAGDKAKLTFYITEDNVANIKVKDVTCF